MLIYLADLAHTYTTKNESLMVPLNIGYLKAYAMEHTKQAFSVRDLKRNFVIDKNISRNQLN